MTFDNTSVLKSKLRWNSIAKPLGGLGLLEDMVSKIAGIQRTEDVSITHRTAVIMCSDNGIVSEGVSQSDSRVTAQVAKEIAAGRSSVNMLANQFSTEILTVDIGIDSDIYCSNIINKKIAYGTRSIVKGPAMDPSQARKAISNGIEIVYELCRNGTDIIITGEMGIGNTTTSAAIASVILGIPAEITAGRGAGLDSSGMSRKIAAIHRAIDVLSKLGGFDIAGMTGLFLGGAECGIPIVIDGVISSVSACLAEMISPGCRDFMLPSHVSNEPSARLLLEKLGLKAPINAGFHLGEGTGGIMLLPLLDGALAVYNGAHRFDEMNMERYKELK